MILNPGLLAKLLKINTAFDELKDLLAADIIPLSIGLELATPWKNRTLSALPDYSKN
ncbi:MAG: hypothetical protein R2860_12645 [Desulfobacterales bacterium]